MKKVDRVIKFNEKARLKLYIEMNAELALKEKNSFEKDFSKLIIMLFFEKIWKRKRTYKYYTCNNRAEKKLFSIRAKLSYCKVFCRTFISNKNEKNSDIKE